MLRSKSLFFAVLGIAALSIHGVAEDKKDYFVFLTTGKSTAGVAPEEIQKKQAAHLENFGRQAKAGSLTAAGPCADPTKITRGIVVVHAPSLKAAEALFESDPYVTEGFMKSEMHPYQVVAGVIKLDLDSNSLEQSVIAIVYAPDSMNAAQRESAIAKLTQFSKAQFDAKKIAFAAVFQDESNNKSQRLGVMIFRGKDVAAVTQLVQSELVGPNQEMRVEAFPQFLAKNALP
jgi:uncharacterized protein YciI